ncbi:hypothetical protein DPX16_22224 [Anabarilius grahami]|uniref:Uncharacterized protein n=1 Tax=Anabarilius grahami TaxID=495550 RepID=A0A3N0XRA7_ANAGA|nr:hypothetical protein DPX16_22224 [Anabarilius grahami]
MNDVGSAHYGKHKVSDLMAVSVLLPRLQPADLASRWQGAIKEYIYSKKMSFSQKQVGGSDERDMRLIFCKQCLPST